MPAEAEVKHQIDVLEGGLKQMKKSRYMNEPHFKNMYGAIEKHHRDVKLAHLTGKAKDLLLQAQQDTRFYYILVKMLNEVHVSSTKAVEQKENLDQVYSWYEGNRHVLHEKPRFGREARRSKSAQPRSLSARNIRKLGELGFPDVKEAQIYKEVSPSKPLVIIETLDHVTHNQNKGQPIKQNDKKQPSTSQKNNNKQKPQSPHSLPENLLPKRKPHPLSHLYNPLAKQFQEMDDIYAESQRAVSMMEGQMPMRIRFNSAATSFAKSEDTEQSVNMRKWEMFRQQQKYGQDQLTKMQYLGRAGVLGSIRYTAHDHGLMAEDFTQNVLRNYSTEIDQNRKQSTQQKDAAQRKQGRPSTLWTSSSLEQFYHDADNYKPYQEKENKELPSARGSVRTSNTSEATMASMPSTAPSSANKSASQSEERSEQEEETIEKPRDIQLNTVVKMIDSVSDEMSFYKEKLSQEPNPGFRQPVVEVDPDMRPQTAPVGTHARPTTPSSREKMPKSQTPRSTTSVNLSDSEVKLKLVQTEPKKIASLEAELTKRSWRSAGVASGGGRPRTAPDSENDKNTKKFPEPKEMKPENVEGIMTVSHLGGTSKKKRAKYLNYEYSFLYGDDDDDTTVMETPDPPMEYVTFVAPKSIVDESRSTSATRGGRDFSKSGRDSNLLSISNMDETIPLSQPQTPSGYADRVSPLSDAINLPNPLDLDHRNDSIDMDFDGPDINDFDDDFEDEDLKGFEDDEEQFDGKENEENGLDKENIPVTENSQSQSFLEEVKGLVGGQSEELINQEEQETENSIKQEVEENSEQPPPEVVQNGDELNETEEDCQRDQVEGRHSRIGTPSHRVTFDGRTTVTEIYEDSDVIKVHHENLKGEKKSRRNRNKQKSNQRSKTSKSSQHLSKSDHWSYVPDLDVQGLIDPEKYYAAGDSVTSQLSHRSLKSGTQKNRLHVRAFPKQEQETGDFDALTIDGQQMRSAGTVPLKAKSATVHGTFKRQQEMLKKQQILPYRTAPSIPSHYAGFGTRSPRPTLYSKELEQHAVRDTSPKHYMEKVGELRRPESSAKEIGDWQQKNGELTSMLTVCRIRPGADAEEDSQRYPVYTCSTRKPCTPMNSLDGHEDRQVHFADERGHTTDGSRKPGSPGENVYLGRPLTDIGRPIPHHLEVNDPDTYAATVQRLKEARQGVDITKNFKGYVNQDYRYLEHEYREQREDQREAAVMIQKIYRGHLVRKRSISRREMNPDVLEWSRRVHAVQNKSMKKRREKAAEKEKQFEQNAKDAKLKLEVIGPNVDIFSAFHPLDEDENELDMHHHALNIQKPVRGWLVRKKFEKLQRKSLSHSKNFSDFIGYYRKLSDRIQTRRGVEKTTWKFDIDETIEFLDKKKKFEHVFDKLSFGGELEYEELPQFFKECDFYPAQIEIDEAYRSVFRGRSKTTKDEQRSIDKNDALEILFTIYPPSVTGIDTTRKSTWMAPIVNGEEANKFLGTDYVEPTNFKTCWKLVANTHKERRIAEAEKKMKEHEEIDKKMYENFLEGKRKRAKMLSQIKQ